MKVTKIRLLACWDGYCGTCRDVRPLVLTQAGRFSLRAWWAGEGGEDRPLTMTCRVCGTGVHVPREEDEPELHLGDELDDEGLVAPRDADGLAVASADPTVAAAPAADASAELTALRTAVATAMAAVVARSSVATGPTVLTAPRAGDHDDTDAALRLLAAGFDTAGLDRSELVREPARR